MTSSVSLPSTVCPCRLPVVALCELDEWDSDITELDTALATAATARQALIDAQAELEALEAAAQLSVEGRNEAERKAKLTLTLRDLIPYQDALAEVREARLRLAEAERRVMVLKERCRLHRAAVQMAVGTTEA